MIADPEVELRAIFRDAFRRRRRTDDALSAVLALPASTWPELRAKVARMQELADPPIGDLGVTRQDVVRCLKMIAADVERLAAT